MKKFSKKWISSKKKKKQRKYRFNADQTTRHHLIKINLSKELREKYKKRNLEPRKDDVIKVMRGKFKKKEGKITNIDLKHYKIYIEGIQLTKKEGTKTNVPIDPSNLQMKEINLNDKKRINKLDKTKS
jgi:large subunit ribosomal protein L24